jgi:uncharacterized protein YjaZ
MVAKKINWDKCFGRYLAVHYNRHVKFLYSFLLKTSRAFSGWFFLYSLVQDFLQSYKMSVASAG